MEVTSRIIQIDDTDADSVNEEAIEDADIVEEEAIDEKGLVVDGANELVKRAVPKEEVEHADVDVLETDIVDVGAGGEQHDERVNDVCGTVTTT